MRVLFVVPLLFVACGSLHVVEQADGTFMAYGESRSEFGSYGAAHGDATKFCKKREQSVVMIKKDTTYQGVNKDTKAIVGAIAMAHAARTGQMGYSDGSRHDDYSTTLHFKCK